MNALGKNSLPLYFTELLTEWAAKQLTNTFASSLSHLFVLFILGFLFDFQRRSNQFLRKFYAKLSPGLGRRYGTLHYMVLLTNGEMHQLGRLYMIIWGQLECVV